MATEADAQGQEGGACEAGHSEGEQRSGFAVDAGGKLKCDEQ